jgi:hypothetical protein
MAAVIQSEDKPEIKIETNWASLCDKESPNTQISHVDSTNRQLPTNAFMLHNLFSLSECEKLINAAETEGRFGYTNYRKEYRGNLRLITNDQSLTDVMWNRIKPFVPSKVIIENDEWEPIGLNECWRLSKYHPGDKFGCHYDASFARSNIEESIFTVNAYMNSEFKQGRTRFYDKLRNGNEIAAIKGEAGSCLIFMQPPGDKLAHDGEEVTGGLKYLFRSDVMYRRVDNSNDLVDNSDEGVDESNDPNGLLMLQQAQDLESESKFQEAIEIYNRLKTFYPAVAEKHKIV